MIKKVLQSDNRLVWCLVAFGIMNTAICASQPPKDDMTVSHDKKVLKEEKTEDKESEFDTIAKQVADLWDTFIAAANQRINEFKEDKNYKDVLGVEKTKLDEKDAVVFVLEAPFAMDGSMILCEDPSPCICIDPLQAYETCVDEYFGLGRYSLFRGILQSRFTTLKNNYKQINAILKKVGLTVACATDIELSKRYESLCTELKMLFETTEQKMVSLLERDNYFILSSDYKEKEVVALREKMQAYIDVSPNEQRPAMTTWLDYLTALEKTIFWGKSQEAAQERFTQESSNLFAQFMRNFPFYGGRQVA